MNYTIIIPHKNIPHLLQKCLDSIPRREDVQIIVVDDNSDSDIVDFENFPGLNDPFVDVIFGKNENGRKGPGYARNLGLERAKGKWLTFADADDFFMPCFNEVLDKYIYDENDIIFFKITSIDIDTLQNSYRHIYTNLWLEQIKQTNDWDISYKLNATCGKLIKRYIVKNNNIFFSEVLWGADVLFGVKTIRFANSRKISEEVIYCATSRGESLINQISIESLLVRNKEIYNANVFLKKSGKKNILLGHLPKFWLQMTKINKLYSVFIIPMMIFKGYGRFVASHIIKRDVYNFKKFRKKTTK